MPDEDNKLQGPSEPTKVDEGFEVSKAAPIDEETDIAMRAVACRVEFQKLLARYNCYTEVRVTISTENKISGEIMILARPNPPKVKKEETKE